MPSTYTTYLNMELPANGEKSGTWGDIVNANMVILDTAVHNRALVAGGELTGALTVNTNVTTPISVSPFTAPEVLFHLAATDATTARILYDTYGVHSNICFRRANGTAASPSAVQTNQLLGSVSGRGYAATAYNPAGGNPSLISIDFYSSQNFTDSAQGTAMYFNTTPLGATAQTTKMIIDNAGYVRMGDATPPVQPLIMASGAYVSVGGTWTNVCDYARKQDFRKFGGVLDALKEMPVDSWSYKAAPEVRHVGPTAQDFRKLFNLGDDEQSISTVDGIGVALAAVKELLDRVDSIEAVLA